MATTLSRPTLPQLLQHLPLLAGLAEQELAGLAAVARANHYSPDTTIFNQGDPCDRFWILRDGRLKIVHLAEDGREVILEVISPGEVFGGAVLFMATHPATARTMTAAETLSFPSEVYSRLIGQHPAIAQNLVRMLGARLHSLMALQVLAGERVERRLAHILLKLADRAGRAEPGGGVLITIPLTRQDLAEMTGTTLETAIRTLSRFRAQGWLETRRGGYILIRDPEQLHAQAGA
jgi:CRP/FNR family transcriptional regulator, nitrogen oxide reductase regulator